MIFSHSKIQTFENCQLRFKLKYLDQIKVPGKSIEMITGRIVHEVLEHLYARAMKGEVIPIEKVNEIFLEQWNEVINDPEIKIVKGTLGDFKQHGLNCLSNYYHEHYPFDKEKTIALEKHIKFSIEDIKFQGYVDRVSMDTKAKTLTLHDYKTGGRAKKHHFVKDTQLNLYAIPFKTQYPDYSINKSYHLLVSGETATTFMNPFSLEQTKHHLLKRARQIKEADYFPPNISPLCNWCEYRSMCPAWK